MRSLSRAVATIALACLAALLAAPPLSPAWAQSDAEMWQMVKESGDRGMLEAFVTAFPESRYAAEARSRLAASGPAPPAAPRPPAAATPPTTTATAPAPAPLPALGPGEVLFEQPRQGAQASLSMRLNACLHWGRDCGKPAADAFCQSQGFADARSFASRIAGGSSWVKGDQQICAQADCASLANVVCQGKATPLGLLPEVTIAAPRINNVPLSHCIYPERNCGKEAAEAYCEAAGYANARQFLASPEGTRSIHFGNGRVCEGPQCRAIAELACSQ